MADRTESNAKARINGVPGPKARPIVTHPTADPSPWTDPPSFPEAFALHLDRHGDTCWHLHKAIITNGEQFDRRTFQAWACGSKLPNSTKSFEILNRIEDRYRLPAGYFRGKIATVGRAPFGFDLPGLSEAERRRIAWHLPEDFNDRTAAAQAEILEWVRSVIISGSTEYRRFQAEAMKARYGLRFPRHLKSRGDNVRSYRRDETLGMPASQALIDEVTDLKAFKTATLAAVGDQRNGIWVEETAAQKIEHLSLMFGALASDPADLPGGMKAPLEDLSLGLLVFPAIWDWYLRWREARRGFFTSWELNMLSFGLSLTRERTGWLRQRPQIGSRLRPIRGLVTQAEVRSARAAWEKHCDVVNDHCRTRFGEIQRVARVHRDPFEPILPILEDDSPVGAYRRIAAEILRRMPDPDRYPRHAAEAIRSFLMLRLGLHLGVRQKNLRQLLICPKESAPRSDRQLEHLRRGEMRWSRKDSGWEVLIPANALKNSTSTFFSKQPFRLRLPDLDSLYAHLDAYIERHRPLLLASADDPGTFFIKTVKRSSSDASYNQTTFYEAWRLTIQRYGIYNPYTGKGAIEGLLPHGPHSVRDVLATHVLKQTGSYEQASYAIQDTPEMVRQHYGRFLPQDKVALAAKVLNEVWAS